MLCFLNWGGGKVRIEKYMIRKWLKTVLHWGKSHLVNLNMQVRAFKKLVSKLTELLAIILEKSLHAEKY